MPDAAGRRCSTRRRSSELRAGAVGPSHASYIHAGHQWGLATDAACQVAAVRDELLGGRGCAAALGRGADARRPPARSRRTAAVAAARHLELAEPGRGASAASRSRAHRPTLGRRRHCRSLAQLGPREALGWEPPDALGRMTTTDEIAYIPLTYGYSTYGTSAERPCRFVDVPAAAEGPRGAVLGGAGLAVSAASAHPAEAAAFAAWASGAEAQHDIVARTGGQPGHRSAWDDPELDALAGGFYSGTRASIEGGVGAPARRLVAGVPARGRATAHRQPARRSIRRTSRAGSMSFIGGTAHEDHRESTATSCSIPDTSGTRPARTRTTSWSRCTPTRASPASARPT